MKPSLLLVSLLWVGISFGEFSSHPPLMPPRKAASTPPAQTFIQTKSKALRSERSALGFEAGVLGVRNQTSSDVLGLQLMYGLRAHYLYPLSSRFFLKPSLGYFIKPESEGEISLTQHLIEGGLGIHYAFGRTQGSLWHLGLIQRADLLFSRISVKTSSATTPASFRYRTGMGLGTRFKLNANSDLSFDLEAGLAPFEKTRIQSSFTTGLVFFLD